MANENINPVFDYRAIRLLMGIIAFSIPFAVSIVSSVKLTSISASYHTEAQDVFVGSLFVVGSFLFAYNGHRLRESVASKLASGAAILVALFPTSCDGCDSSLVSNIHLIAAATLFLILAYFCFIPFRRSTRGVKGKKGRRSIIYLICGSVMILCMLVLAYAKLTLTLEEMDALRVMYYAEAVALVAFGIAWIVSGKKIGLLTDDDEKLKSIMT